MADNVLGSSSGWWIDDVGHPVRDAVVAFNQLVAADAAFVSTAMPFREGVLFSTKARGDVQTLN
jgi:hypothetical protein